MKQMYLSGEELFHTLYRHAFRGEFEEVAGSVLQGQLGTELYLVGS
jgi:hypothetical protein